MDNNRWKLMPNKNAQEVSNKTVNNNSKLAKWLTGYLVFLALILTINHFVKLEVDVFVFGAITLITYLGVYFLIRFKAISIKILVALIIFLALIYAVDYALMKYNGQSGQDLILQNGTQVLNRAEGKNDDVKRHEVAIIHELRDFIDYENVITFGKWVIFERVEKQLINGETIPSSKKYEFYLLIAISLLMTLLLSLVFEVKLFKSLLIVPIVLYVWLWYQFIDLPWIISGLYFGGTCAFFIMDHHEKLLKAHPEYNTAYYPARKLMLTSILTGFVVIILAGVITAIFPIKQVNFIVDTVTPNLWGARSGYLNNQLKMYSLQETAFSGSTDILGGPVGPINMEDPIFWVKFDQKIDKAIYLKTAIKDHYDGLKWVNNGTVYKNDFKFYLSDPSNIELLKSGAYEKISGAIRINKKETKTVTLFTPMGLYETSLGNKKVYVSGENEAFYKAGTFVQYLKDYTFSATGRDFYIAPEVDYLQLSNRIEPRTTELALTLGGLRGTDYEKMTVITDFLSRNYTYSLSPLSNRDRRDFVSEFLFESKKGYCTYFASSLAILARINGIPSRYVEGFRVDPNEVDPEGDYSKVTERDAHAWAEVYLEGYGWVVFESTPIYSEAGETTATPSLEELLEAEADDNDGVTPGDSQSVTETPINLEDLLAENDGGRGDLGGGVPRTDTVDAKSNTKTVILIIGGLLLLVVLIVLSRLPLTYLRRRTSHAYAIRILYYLAYLTAESKDYMTTEPEAVFTRSSFPKNEVTLWLKVLYDRKEKVTSDMVLKAIDTASTHIKTATEAYKYRKGKIAYLKLRALKIDKLIP
jgi:hypothetical protein